MIQNLPLVTRALLIALAVVFVIASLAPALAVAAFPFYPTEVIPGGQLWRVVTYPLMDFSHGGGVLGNLIRILWDGMLIVFFGGELEMIMHEKRFAIVLASLVLAGAILFAIIAPNGVLVGTSILTMFMLAGFAYMWPTRQIAIFGLFWVKAWIIAVVLFAIEIIPSSGFQLDTSATNLFAPLFGAVAAIVFFHLSYKPHAISKIVFGGIRRKAQANRARQFPTDPVEVSRRIDEILDKISTSGMQSLSKQEKQFLLEHSRDE